MLRQCWRTMVVALAPAAFASLLVTGALLSTGLAAGAKKGEVCGGIVGIDCALGLYCAYPAGKCEMNDLSGRCETSPEMCTARYDPVCGCDGKEYGNDCVRTLARARKAHDGPCKPR